MDAERILAIWSKLDSDPDTEQIALRVLGLSTGYGESAFLLQCPHSHEYYTDDLCKQVFNTHTILALQGKLTNSDGAVRWEALRVMGLAANHGELIHLLCGQKSTLIDRQMTLVGRYLILVQS